MQPPNGHPCIWWGRQRHHRRLRKLFAGLVGLWRTRSDRSSAGSRVHTCIAGPLIRLPNALPSGLTPLSLVMREILLGVFGALEGWLLVAFRLCLGERGARQAEYAAEKNQLS